MTNIVQYVSTWTIPFLLIVIPLIGLWRRIPVYESFVEGAKAGFSTAVRIIPYLVAMFVAIRVFQYSGAMQWFIHLISPVTAWLGIPEEVIPLAFVRPLSGSGALGILASILETYGPDSFIGRLASTIQGSTETTFYVLTVYFGAVGVRRVRHALPASLASDIFGLLASIYIVTRVFGH